MKYSWVKRGNVFVVCFVLSKCDTFLTQLLSTVNTLISVFFVGSLIANDRRGQADILLLIAYTNGKLVFFFFFSCARS